ncbi:Abi family protein [Enterobacter oligotrophicus]|uniref:Abi family protein n=1 Tax=Enterobacter TaxID=547 RepID=UPI001C009797|nr:Abi family protein [Enterobacter oligotrophicus]ELW1648673.1 Abi family protein [Enterobacter oligotrophicus]MBT9427643.1 Abi family protein [Enterobacter oligotrophicus]
MPQATNYAPIVSLISSVRLDSYRTTFRPTDECELYGMYIWSQHAAASIYPLLQNLEISLRNAVDKEARARFGEMWWDRIQCAKDRDECHFHKNIEKAKDCLTREWRKKELRRRRGNRPQAQPIPVWSHDQIIASTDFSTWHYVLNNEYSALAPRENQQYLWPKSLSKVFKNYARINPNPQKVRKELIDLLFELREYRNRISHHEPIWVKAPNVNDARTAIDTIRVKINKIELVIEALDINLLNIMRKVGLFDNARRVCSVEELNIYRYTKPYCALTPEQISVIDQQCRDAKEKNETIIWEHNAAVYGLRALR